MIKTRTLSFRALALGVLVMVSAPLGARAADDYSNSDYLQHDLDNYSRARGRTIYEANDPEYHKAFASACADVTGRQATRSASEARFGRVYGSVGNPVCWWSTGHAPDYFDVGAREIHFLSRSGAKLSGHIWGAEAPGPRPGVVITTGSIQATEEMYWWAARALVAAGYQVMTWDVQGQGASESVGHAPGSPIPTTTGVPSQQNFNFYEGTIDALRFFLSTPGEEYTPQGWTATDVAAAKLGADGEHVDWTNPGWGVLDHDRLGIAGHSLGAGAVSAVQQCSDEGVVWQTLALCGGRSFPIRAVVAWDALSSSVTPVVPAMDQKADGYFLFPTATPTAPDPAESLPAYNKWRSANQDVFMYVERAATHIDWSQVPYTAATRYGVFANSFYTVAWMDRWVSGDGAVRQAAYDRLVSGPTSEASKPWAANYFSARRLSALSLRAPGSEGGSADVEAVDLRKWAGRSAVGDWAGANADTAGRILP
jgi:hypothetical protein